MDNFDYTVFTKKSFDEAVKSVEEETKNAGFRVLYIHDVAATLAEKTFRLNRLRLLKFVMPKALIQSFKLTSKLDFVCLVKNKCLHQRRTNIYLRNETNYFIAIFSKANLGNLPTEVDSIKKLLTK